MFDPSIKKRRTRRRSRGRRWRDLHPDLLVEIFKHLDLVNYIRFRAVCVSWRVVPPEIMKKDVWLLISTPDMPDSRCFYSLNSLLSTQQQDKSTARRIINLPQIEGRHCIGSSQGFIITIDDCPTLCAINPLTGTRFPLPPTATHPEIFNRSTYRLFFGDYFIPDEDDANINIDAFHYKAVISPCLGKIVVMALVSLTNKNDPLQLDTMLIKLAFYGVGDNTWTYLNSPKIHKFRERNETYDAISDIIFHKDRLYVLHFDGRAYVFDLENPTIPPLAVSKPGPKARTPMLLTMFLAETPDRKDLLLIWRRESEEFQLKLRNLKVFKLDKKKLKWSRTQDIGEVALFFGGTYLLALSTREFPNFQSNCIYFTCMYDSSNQPPINRPNQKYNDVRIFSLKDGSICRFNPDDVLRQLHWPPPIWFIPKL